MCRSAGGKTQLQTLLLIQRNTQEEYLVHFLTTKNASSTILDVSEPSSSESILTAC